MDFRILGPLEVLSDGQPLDLGGQKQRALLALLLLEANRVVSSGRLIDALWEEEPPETAQKALQVYVSQLRKLLGKERLQTQAPGYRLRVEPDELDLARFQHLQEQGRLQEALALWRGPPLAEFAYQRFAQVEIGRLEELRLACLEERIEGDLGEGRHAELVGELEALVQEHPLRERLRTQLMLALYRSGRQAEALEAYQDARRALTEELGIEPGRSLRDLHQAVLNQDSALDLALEERWQPEEPVIRRPRLPSGTVTFLFTDIEGSTGLLKHLRDRYGEVLADHRRILCAAFAAHAGQEIDSQGDAFFFAFSRARDAALAAAEAQRALASHAWPEGVELRVRMGLHTGEPALGDEGYHGLGVHRGARIMAAGHGGQTLLSQATTSVLIDDELPGLDLRDLGEYHLKDLDRPERIHQLVVEGLPDEFPPLRTEAVATPYRGREAELAEAVEAAVGPPSHDRHGPVGRKTITAMFVGVAISSARGEGLDPEALRRMTSDAFGTVQAAVERHGGTVETVTGDSITAAFGLPTVHEDDALRGARAAVEVHDALSRRAVELGADRALELDFRIGISTGEVVTGGEAGPQLRATGEPLTRSSRLGHAAGSAEIVIDAATRRLLRDAIVAEEADDAWRLLELQEAGLGVAPRLVSPMVGRERERRRLNDAFDQAVGDRSCQLFTVLGLAGVGKSRLVREFLGDLAEQALVARGRCLPYGEGITFWPLLEAVKDVVGLEDTDGPDQALGKLIAALGEEQSAELVARRVGEMIGLAEAAGGADEGFAAVRALFEVRARTQPLVVVFDDIHWGEATFLDLVEHLAEWVRDAPVLLLCIARPELLDMRPGWGGGKLNATSTLLEPLSDGESLQLIENLVGRAGFAEDVEARIAAAAEGNPLFVEEMLSMLIDDGLLVRRNGGWEAAGDVATVRVPPTIHALLAARLDQLDAGERVMTERAAVQGKVFYEDAVAALAPKPLQPGVAEFLKALVRKELIRPHRASLGGQTYRFRHLLIRDAAYESISKEARADLHERFGRWLGARAGDRATEYEEIVGYHLEQAYHLRAELAPVDAAARELAHEAAVRLGSAGRRAFIRSDAPAAVNLISRAVVLLPPDDPVRVDLVPNVRVVQGMGIDMSWADLVLTEAVEAAATTGNRRLAAHALVQRGFLRLFTEAGATAEELVDVAERAIAVFEELGDELGLTRAWRLVAQAHYLARRLGACAEASERALEHVRRAGDHFEEREIVEWLLVALFFGPAPATEAAGRCERLLEESSGNAVLEVEILGAMAFLVAMQGRLPEAEEQIARARRIMDEFGEWIWLFFCHTALVSLLRDDPVAAERELRPAYDALKKIGEKSHFSAMAFILADAVYRQGRYEEAEQLTRECEEAAQPNDVQAQIIWRSTRAKVLARRGEFEGAQRLAREAVAFASESDLHLAHGDALMDLGEVLELAGEEEAAAAAIQQAIDLYELKGNVLAANRARALVAAT
jgi:class 3 adenylate cyclase